MLFVREIVYWIKISSKSIIVTLKISITIIFFLFFEFFQTYVSKIMEKIFELDSDSELNIFFYPSLEVDYKLDIGIVFGYDTFIKFIHKTHS